MPGSGECMTGRILPEPAPAASLASQPGPATLWLEVFRATEQHRTLPDFLDNHDSGDVGGAGAIASLVGSASPLSAALTWTRYCVELERVRVVNTTTTTFEGTPATSAFADYRSTNPTWMPPFTPATPGADTTPGAEYSSWCAVTSDRYVGSLSRANILAAGCETSTLAPRPWLCNCTVASTASSARYTGMMPIGSPVYFQPLTPGIYPDAAGRVVGRWFSHPYGTRCRLGARVGDNGSTWHARRSPTACTGTTCWRMASTTVPNLALASRATTSPSASTQPYCSPGRCV